MASTVNKLSQLLYQLKSNFQHLIHCTTIEYHNADCIELGEENAMQVMKLTMSLYIYDVHVSLSI